MAKITDTYNRIQETIDKARALYAIPEWVTDRQIFNAGQEHKSFDGFYKAMQELAAMPNPQTSSGPGHLMSNAERDRLLAASPSPDRVTPEYMWERIQSVTYTHPDFDKGETFTLCKITLDNSFVVFGESACVDPANYRKDLGEKIAYGKAFEKLWPLFGFLLAEKRFVAAPQHNAHSSQSEANKPRVSLGRYKE